MYTQARPTQVTAYFRTLDMMADSFTLPLNLTRRLRDDTRKILGPVIWNAIGRPQADNYDWPLLDETASRIVDKMCLPRNSSGEISLSEPTQYNPAYFLTRLLTNRVDISPRTRLPQQNKPIKF